MNLISSLRKLTSFSNLLLICLQSSHFIVYLQAFSCLNNSFYPLVSSHPSSLFLQSNLNLSNIDNVILCIFKFPSLFPQNGQFLPNLILFSHSFKHYNFSHLTHCIGIFIKSAQKAHVKYTSTIEITSLLITSLYDNNLPSNSFLSTIYWSLFTISNKLLSSYISTEG